MIPNKFINVSLRNAYGDEDATAYRKHDTVEIHVGAPRSYMDLKGGFLTKSEARRVLSTQN